MSISSLVNHALSSGSFGYLIEASPSFAAFIQDKAAIAQEKIHFLAQPFIPFLQETLFPAVRPYGERIITPLAPFLYPAIEAAKEAPSTLVAPDVAGATAAFIIVAYKISRAASHYAAAKLKLSDLVNIYLPTAPTTPTDSPSLKHSIFRWIRFTADMSTHALFFTSAAAAAYHASIALGAPLTLPQILKISGSAAIPPLLYEVAKTVARYTLDICFVNPQKREYLQKIEQQEKTLGELNQNVLLPEQIVIIRSSLTKQTEQLQFQKQQYLLTKSNLEKQLKELEEQLKAEQERKEEPVMLATGIQTRIRDLLVNLNQEKTLFNILEEITIETDFDTFFTHIKNFESDDKIKKQKDNYLILLKEIMRIKKQQINPSK